MPRNEQRIENDLLVWIEPQGEAEHENSNPMITQLLKVSFQRISDTSPHQYPCNMHRSLSATAQHCGTGLPSSPFATMR